ncbi:signal peptidase II [Thalassospira sp.]|uniref:signal peptidase II n=1 Tax=Thalassospira sp. TaxID=1912094 RepID=UPI001B05AE5E|nr:signal peptidase II [Thalassospira sp.]MBO6773823.1 signal peptidase II [Thalassospira sp.]
MRVTKQAGNQSGRVAQLLSQRCAGSTLLLVVATALLGAIIVDQATKFAALTFLSAPTYKIEVTPFFNLRLGFNTGVSFGVLGDIFSNQQWPLIAITTAIAVALTVWALRVDRLLEALAISLIAGGAIGNIIDRIRQGAVTDFLDFHAMGWHWPAFNFADVFIFIGAALLIILSFLTPDTNEVERGEIENGS